MPNNVGLMTKITKKEGHMTIHRGKFSEDST